MEGQKDRNYVRPGRVLLPPRMGPWEREERDARLAASGGRPIIEGGWPNRGLSRPEFADSDATGQSRSQRARRKSVG
jgi:hypothetical protein